MTSITVRYSSIDRFKKHYTFKTLKGASAWARKWVGDHPDLGSDYAISDDGVGKITVSGATLAEIFPQSAEAIDPREGDHEAFCRSEDEWTAVMHVQGHAAALAANEAMRPKRELHCTCSDQQLNLVGCECPTDETGAIIPHAHAPVSWPTIADDDMPF